MSGLPSARGWTQRQVARRLGVSEGWFSENRERLYKSGLPRPDGITKRTDEHAVERYMNQRSGIVDQGGEDGPDLSVTMVRERAHGIA